MGQSWSGQRTIQAAYERRGKKVALKSRQSKDKSNYDGDYYFSPNADASERYRYSQAASNSVTAKPGHGGRKSTSSHTSHPTHVKAIGKFKKEHPSPSDRHRTKKEAPKKPKSSHTHDKTPGRRSTKHNSIHRVDSRHQNDEHHSKKESKECAVCTDALSLHHFPDRPPTKNCKHGVDVCRKCLRTWIASESNVKMWNDITCPICKTQLRTADMREFAPKDIFKRYDSLLPYSFSHLAHPRPLNNPTNPPTSYMTLSSRAKAESRPGFRWCGLKGCKAGQVHLPNYPSFRCNTCEKTSCVVHNVAWHKGETCAEYDYRTNGKLKKAEEEASRKVVEKTTKACPGCKRPIEKNRGCDHMTCKFFPVCVLLR